MIWPARKSSASTTLCTSVQLRDNLSQFSPKRKELFPSNGKLLHPGVHNLTPNDHSPFRPPTVALLFQLGSFPLLRALYHLPLGRGRHGYGCVTALSHLHPYGRTHDLCSPYVRASSLPPCWRVPGVSWDLANSPQVPFVIFARGLKFFRNLGK